jgi:predicted RNase H-like nuclease (RuvC/YqgF family)
MSVNQITAAKEMTLPPMERRTSSASVAQTTITQAVAKAQAEAKAEMSETVVETNPLTEQQELQNLRQIIVTWREIEGEVSTLSAQIREKNKRKKALEEMILRIMKKYNIGALDLKGSGGRLLYRKQTTKASLNPKTLTGLLAGHLKSETAAAEAIKYIVENREARPRESLLYEKS